MGLLDTARSVSVTKGVLGGNRRWLALAGVLWGLRAIQMVRHPAPRTLYRQVLEAGETLTISAIGPPPTRRELRGSARAERRLRRREARTWVLFFRARNRHRVL
jgi:hypothetical protein